MAGETIYIGQSLVKDSVVGSRAMNRYAIFNGLERPRRIDEDRNVTLLGVDAPDDIVSITAQAGGTLDANKWYAYRAVYASSAYTRPVANADGSGNYTRGNPGTVDSGQTTGVNLQFDVVVPGTTQAGITHILLYRSLGASTQAEAEVGPFYFAESATNAAGNVTITDNTSDDTLGGLAVETDNFRPNAYRFAVQAEGYIFAGGNFVIGSGFTVTATGGSSSITANGNAFYDGITGWTFKIRDDSTGGVDGKGNYFANYVSATEIQLVDANGDAVNYDGSEAGAGNTFSLYLTGDTLRWSKKGEPEAWPTTNLIQFDGKITGIIQVPNQPVLIVCTDEPTMYALDLTLIGTYSFKVNKRLISSEYSVSSHYSLIPVEGRLRGIDMRSACIIETDGASVNNITQGVIPRIFDSLDGNAARVGNWHCAYDKKQKIFGAFVTFKGAQRIVDFCIGQNTVTGSWFFNWEKDLLCTASYTDPATGSHMVLGGTEGLLSTGAVWGRIWTPNVYDEWIPDGTLRQTTVTNVVSGNTFDVDVTSGNLHTSGGGLAGRWVLVCDTDGENAQVGYIQSNTASRIVCRTVINGTDPTGFNPAMATGWLVYLGLIECRWGPRRLDFDDPDTPKNVFDIHITASNYDTSGLPFMRLFKGFDQGYTKQISMYQDMDITAATTDTLRNKVDGKLIAGIHRWGMAMIERSYDKFQLRSVTVTFNRVGKKVTDG